MLLRDAQVCNLGRNENVLALERCALWSGQSIFACTEVEVNDAR